jgi:flagellin
MTVSTIASIAANLSRVTAAQDSKPAAVLSSLVASSSTSTDTTAAIVASDNTADVSLQSQIAQFSVASQSIALGNSVLATASTGGADISRELGALHDLAQQAANVPLSDRERAQIDAQFQAIRSRINAIASTTKFGDDNLLDGSAAASANLTDEALFQGANPNLQTVANSQAAVQQVAQAQQYTTAQLATVASLQSGLDYASSTVQTAQQNVAASQSTLDDSDFDTDTTSNSSFAGLDVQAAQTSRLPSSLLGLLTD